MPMTETQLIAFGVEHREHGRSLYVTSCLSEQDAWRELWICQGDSTAECRVVTATWLPLDGRSTDVQRPMHTRAPAEPLPMPTDGSQGASGNDHEETR